MIGVGFHPEARAELLASVEYYDEQADGLGRQFTDEVERAVRLVAEQPGLGSPIAGTEELRRWSLRRFSYYLITVRSRTRSWYSPSRTSADGQGTGKIGRSSIASASRGA